MKFRMLIKLSLILVILISGYNSQLNVMSPYDLTQTMKQLFPSNGNIDYHLGNFGEIPYGKTIVGYTFYDEINGNNTWCNFETTVPPVDFDRDPDNDYSPLYIVDHGDCPYTRKAYNVRARGGRVMILVSNDETYKYFDNVDDKLGERVDIPTIIVKKSTGDILKDYIKKNKQSKVTMSVKFTGVKDGENLLFEFFLRSDDVKALHFFKEFEQYYGLLKNKFTFKPVYKYYRGIYSTSSDELDSERSEPCIKSSQYCGSTNTKLNIQRERIVLMENIRQSCIYQLNTKDLDPYWYYMITFSDTCADLNNPLFDEKCSKNVMSALGIDEKQVNECMEKLIKNQGKIEDDTQLFKDKKVYKIPEILLNGIKYKGSWLSKYIFHGICGGFMDENDPICKTNKNAENSSGHAGLGFGSILLIIVVITAIMIVLLLCYRRIVNKSLEASLNEKIQSQTIFSLGQYQVFKDENTGRKSIDITKL